MLLANKELKAELETLLEGLKLVRQHLQHGEKDDALVVLEQAGTMLANLINDIKPPR